jgi:hypothetical protein
MGKMPLCSLARRACDAQLFFKGRFVRFENCKLVNNGRDICRNKHPHESQDEFIERVGLVHYKTRDVPTRVQGHVEAPKVITLEKSIHPCDRYTTSTNSWLVH